MSDRPRGRLNLPRFSDIWPMVSHHRTPASQCDIEVCYDGYSKEEVFRSVRDAYVTYTPKLKQTLENNGVNVVDIVISGSLVKGDFGCRDQDKILEEIDELQQTAWLNSEFGREIQRIVENNEQPQVMWRKINDAAEERKRNVRDDMHVEIDIKVEDALIAICSDIDMFIVFPDSSSQEDERRYRELDRYQGPLDSIFGDIQDTIKGNMLLISSVSNVSLQNRLNKPTLSSEEEFNKILRRFYNADNR